MNNRFKNSKRIKKEIYLLKNINKPIILKSFILILLVIIFIVLLKHIISVQSSKKTFEKSIIRFL